MKSILIDTNAYAAFKKNDPATVNIIRTVEYIGINIVVFGELLSGFKGGTRETANRKEFEQFLESPRVHVLELDEETAEFYATIFWDLKRKGKPVPTNDLWVAASAMRHGLALFTYDDHFKNITGLIIHK
ncbi:MAG TPA: type II toxin-antitoxin system VapC family toxin [Dissulfurispiraceae bacterium]|nr:type II toxin-antitoxin system VapC family toxin [Dissulfurispiraceae bacterium]